LILAGMNIRILILVIGLIQISNDLQSQSSIEGIVIDVKTKEPLPGATVYLANTTHGTSAVSTGSFLLDQIEPGKYDLIVSMVGYKPFSRPLLVDQQVIKDLTVSLEEEVKQLDAIEITAKKNTNRADLGEFRKFFLGQTPNSYQCDIINLPDIFVYKDGPKLYATSRKPIVVENKALGYRIIYTLKEFLVDYHNNIIRMAGVPRFENLAPKNEKEQKKWIKERDRTYYGSMQHFIRSLKKRELKKNHFSIWDSHSVEANEETLFKNSGNSEILYKGELSLVFNPESFYDPRKRGQESTLNFFGRKITIYDNGYYENYQDVLLLGYLGWSLNVAEMVPLGYQPTSPLK